MTLRVSGKNLDIGEALRTKAEERVASAFAKYFDGGYQGHVTVSKDGAGFHAEGVMHLASGVTLEASGFAHDAYASFDQLASRIEKRLRRYKRRLKDRPNGAAAKGEAALESPYTVLEAPSEESEDHEDEFHPVVVAETTRTLHRLAVSEAVLELDMTGTPVVVFIHAGTGRMNVVYRRRDGAVGWIDPPAGRN